MKQRKSRQLLPSVISSLLILGLAHCTVLSQTRIMPLGDSITQGGQGYASYRYELWFDLLDEGFEVDFVGQRDSIFGKPPVLDWYLDYDTFDRDHEGYWGWRTDEIVGVIFDATAAGKPDIVLVHLGTNDIGQMGMDGVANAEVNLRLTIDTMRSVLPDVTILLAQVIPIGPGTSYYEHAAQVGHLNAAIASVAADMDLPESRVILVDQNSGFDLDTMMRPDGLHPNRAGESRMSEVWLASLMPLLPQRDRLPGATTASPGDSSRLRAPVDVTIEGDGP